MNPPEEVTEISWREYIEHFMAFEHAGHQSSGDNWFAYQSRDGWKNKIWFPKFGVVGGGDDGLLRAGNLTSLDFTLQRWFGWDIPELESEQSTSSDLLADRNLEQELRNLSDEIANLEAEVDISDLIEDYGLIEANRMHRGIYVKIRNLEAILLRMRHLTLLGQALEGPKMARKK